MQLVVSCGDEHTGTVIGAMHAQRAEVDEVQVLGTSAMIVAQAPLAQLFSYIAKLRSQTAGRGSFTMEPAGFKPVAT